MSNMGRPPLEINWDKVKGLLEAGCSGREIAGNIGVSAQTLYDRCVTDNGIEFSHFSQQHQAKGESRLLAHQYAKALGLTNEGDNTLLIWLGKVRLKQKEISDKEIQEKINMDLEAKKQLEKYKVELATEAINKASPEVAAQLKATLDQLSSMQSDSLDARSARREAKMISKSE